MRLRTLSLAILFAGLGLWTLFVQQESQRLTRRLSELGSRLDELQTVETENVRLKGLLARQQMSETEVDRLRGEARDVLRLRAEVTSLRNLRQENQKLMETIFQLSNQVQTAIQVAESWRNFRWPAGPGVLSNAPSEFLWQPEQGTVLSGLPRDQWRGAESGNVSLSAAPGAQPLPAFAPVPAPPPAPGQPTGELPPDHAKMSNLECASCHAGMVNPQGTVGREVLKLSESIFPRHVTPPVDEFQAAITAFKQSFR